MNPIAMMTSSLGIGFGDLLTLITGMVLIIFYAVDLRMGIVLTFLFFSVDVIIFDAMQLPTTNIVILTFGAFVLLCLSMYVSVSKNNQAVF